MKIRRVNLESANSLSAKKTAAEKQPVQTSYKQITELPGVYYKPLSFGRSHAEHKSWGATVDPKTKEVSFKILTFPDTKGVTVTVSKNGNESESKTYKLTNKGEGIFETDKKISSKEISHGDKYYFTIYKSNGETEVVKDPYSSKQESLLGASTVYDHSLYKWNDKEWFEKNPQRISRIADGRNNLNSVRDAKIFEFNTAALTKGGTFEDAKKVIDDIVKTGFNAIEIMPVENTYSFNWGYDGVDKFAPAEHLGGPDGLKDFIDYAHQKGLNVIMDMVPNHLGPDGAALAKTGPYIKGPNAFGEAFNYEGKDSKYVRDYMVNACLNWLENYHCDGLRLDMTKFMESDYTMKQIAAEVNFHKPDAFLIAEDGRSDSRVVSKLNDYETGVNESDHCSAIERISDFNTDLNHLGFDSEWDFDLFHMMQSALYGNPDIDVLDNICLNSGSRVKYFMSHDEIGNFDGSRLVPKLMVPALNLNENVTFDNEDKKRTIDLSKLKNIGYNDAKNTVVCQKAQLTSEKLAVMLLSGELDKYNTEGLSDKKAQSINQKFISEVLIPLGIKENSGITFESVKEVYLKSFEKNKSAMAKIYSIPGPVMVFNGDQNGDLTPFRFFRQFESVKDEDYLYTEKGYKYGKAALLESKPGNIKYSDSGKKQLKYIQTLTSDLNKIKTENASLTKGRVLRENSVKHQISQVLGTHSKDEDSGNETFTVTNFLNEAYPEHEGGEYMLKFPKGQWIQLLSTDDKKYGGSGKYNNSEVINSDGINNTSIKLSPYSTIIFKKIG